jgi:hypothetical protein
VSESTAATQTLNLRFIGFDAAMRGGRLRRDHNPALA